MCPRGGGAWSEGPAVSAVDDPGAPSPVQGLQSKIGDLVIVRIFPNVLAALEGGIVSVLGVAVQDGWS